MCVCVWVCYGHHDCMRLGIEPGTASLKLQVWPGDLHVLHSLCHRPRHAPHVKGSSGFLGFSDRGSFRD